MAFEEQLGRNRTLVKQIAELVALPTPQPSKASKAKAALKWLIKQLNEGVYNVYVLVGVFTWKFYTPGRMVMFIF